MNYLNLLVELNEQGVITLCSNSKGNGWLAVFTPRPKGSHTVAVDGETPEQAIRKIYMKVNPIVPFKPSAGPV